MIYPVPLSGLVLVGWFVFWKFTRQTRHWIFPKII